MGPAAGTAAVGGSMTAHGRAPIDPFGVTSKMTGRVASGVPIRRLLVRRRGGAPARSGRRGGIKDARHRQVRVAGSQYPGPVLEATAAADGGSASRAEGGQRRNRPR